MTTQEIPKNNTTSYLRSITNGAVKLTSAAVLGGAGLACMSAGIYLGFQTIVKTNDFYFSKEGEGKGFSDVPGFDNGCPWVSDQFSKLFGTTGEENQQEFCSTFGNKNL